MRTLISSRNAPALLVVLFMALSCEQASQKSGPSPRFNHVYLMSSDVEASVKFYTEAFDVEVFDNIKKIKRTSPNGQAEAYDTRIVLLRFQGQAFNLEIGGQKGFVADNDQSSYTHIGIDVADIEASQERLLKAGAIAISPITLVEANDIAAKTAFFNGPNGEVLELMQVIKGEF